MLKKLLSTFIAISLLLLLSACGNKEDKSTNYNHAFSVGENKQVYFASGNLQYNPSLNEWKFAENQYDFSGLDNQSADTDFNGWLDLFCWGANGLSGIEPYSTVYDNSLYGDGHNSIANTKYDFSAVYNAQTGENWRMFTHDEIHYLLMFRDNAEKLFGYGTINGIKGLFLLPDDWQSPDGIDFKPSVDTGFDNQYDWYYTIGDKENYTYNIFTSADWKQIETAGGVFLPAAGIRSENICERVGVSGHYWTSSNYGEEFANSLCLMEQDLFLEGNFDRSYGLSIRLIKDAE